MHAVFCLPNLFCCVLGESILRPISKDYWSTLPSLFLGHDASSSSHSSSLVIGSAAVKGTLNERGRWERRGSVAKKEGRECQPVAFWGFLKCGANDKKDLTSRKYWEQISSLVRYGFLICNNMRLRNRGTMYEMLIFQI